MPLIVTGLGVMAAGAGAQAYAAHQQGKAADAAAKAQASAIASAKKDVTLQSNWAREELDKRSAQAQDIYGQYYNQARGDVGAQHGAALGQLYGGYNAVQSALSPLQQLQSYGAQATKAVNLGDPFAGFESDPGYQFRQQQGEESIMRAASAMGGRVSGRTLQELSSFNQGLASQEYQNFAQRQLAARGQDMSAALAAQQNQMALAGLGYGAQSQLAGYGMQTGLAGMGLESQYGAQLGAMGLGAGEFLGNMEYQTGLQKSNVAMNRAGIMGGLAGSQVSAAGMAVPYAGGTAAAIGNMAGQVGGSLFQYGLQQQK